MAMRIYGACHCGAVRYAAEIDPGGVTICHCTDCQVLTGTAFRVSVTAAPSDLSITGDPKVYAKRADSGRVRNQYFCGDCGTPLFTNAAGDAPGPWGIRWGSIRQRARLSPTAQIWRRSAAPWVCAFDEAPAKQEE
jgi:hypothetical protein